MDRHIPGRVDVTRTTLAVLFIAILIVASFWVVRPFITSFIWATTIVVSTWPILLRIQAITWHRRGIAVALMTLMLLLVLIVPFTLAIATVVGHTDDITNWFKSLGAFSIPPAPAWVKSIPLAGNSLAKHWQEYTVMRPDELSARVAPYAGKVVYWFAAQAGGFGAMVLTFLLTVIISAILYAHGETAAAGVRQFARRLAGEKGDGAALLAAKAVRGVALGVVVTAIVQATLGGIGLAITGVPAAVLLTAVMFILCIAQLGPAFVLIPAIIWLFWRGEPLWGTILILWSIPVGLLDNIMRPVLIKKGADLPLLLIFTGVIGGLIAFGIVGLFVGPVVLAVAYVLLEAWVSETEPDQKQAAADDEQAK
jgi:predicted PurR-regulated permease PerM